MNDRCTEFEQLEDIREIRRAKEYSTRGVEWSNSHGTQRSKSRQNEYIIESFADKREEPGDTK